MMKNRFKKLFHICFSELSYHSKPIVCIEVKKMNTKLIVALVIVGVLAVTLWDWSQRK